MKNPVTAAKNVLALEFDEYTSVKEFVDSQQGTEPQFCFYLDWAWISGYDLKGDEDTLASYEELRTGAC